MMMTIFPFYLSYRSCLFFYFYLGEGHWQICLRALTNSLLFLAFCVRRDYLVAQQTQFKIPQGHSGACLFSIQFFFFVLVIFSCCFSGIPRSWKERNRPKDLAFIFLVGFFDFFWEQCLERHEIRGILYKDLGVFKIPRRHRQRVREREMRSRTGMGED